ncbi:MAG: ATP-binding cassette domain-containing protein [Mycoplasmoidaceae bacterium]|nr:ATP-binding cassette domain-containing protein [Mycoplasmoidaceae bacterium]
MSNNVINKNFGTKNIITCDNVQICIGPKKKPIHLIDNFNYSFEKGKVYAIVGNSGVGKTTLVSQISGLTKLRFGNVFIKDKAILSSQKKVKQYKEIRKDVGIVFQFPEYQLFKDTVEKDIAFGPINYHVNKENAKKLASKYMYLVGLDKALLKANPFDLSNGQKRLVALAGVLALETDVIILDEPTAGLDPSYQKKNINIIKDLSKHGKTIIIITHNMDNVLELADQVLVIHNNTLLKTGTPYEIFNDNQLINNIGLDVPHVILEARKHPNVLPMQPRSLDDLLSLIKKGGTNV